MIAPRARDTQADDALAYEAIDLALRVGEATLAVGMSAASTTATVLRIAAIYGLTSCQAEVTFTSITLSVFRDDGEPVTASRLVKVRSTDYTRMAELHELISAISPEITPSEALERLDSVLAEPHPYRRWIVTFALAGMAGAVAGLLGGGLLVALLAAVTTGAIDRLLRVLNRWALPLFFQQVAGAGLAAGVAVALYAVEPSIGLGREALQPSLVVAAGLTVLLAGLAFVGSAEDAIAGFYLTASARAFEVAMLTVGILTGLVGLLSLGVGLDVEPNLVDEAVGRGNSLPLVLQALLAAVIAGCFAIASYARPSAVLVVAAFALATYCVFAAFRQLGVDAVAASACSALALGLLAEIAGSRTAIPPLVITSSGITPLLPGLALYSAVGELVSENQQIEGLAGLVDAAAIALALAGGVALGSFIGSPLSAEYDRFDRRVRRKARSPRD